MSQNLDKIKRTLVEQLGIREDEITLSSNLIEDLAADSLDLVELVMALEEEFETEIPDADAETFNTVQDIVRYFDARFPATSGA